MRNRPELTAAVKKKLLVVAAVAVLLCVFGDSTLAYLITGTDPLTQVFHPAKVSHQLIQTVQADANGAVVAKKDLQVKNNGEADIYVRATIVVKWVSENGTVTTISPIEGTDYTIDFAADTPWTHHSEDGFWYYTEPVKPGEQTAYLFSHCGRTQNPAPLNCHLSIEVLTQAVQATPPEAVKDAWGIDPSTLT